MDLFEGDRISAAWAVRDGLGIGLAILVNRNARWKGEFEYRADDDEEVKKYAILPPQHLSEEKMIASVSLLMEDGCFAVKLADPIKIVCVELRSDDIDHLDLAIDIFKRTGFIDP